MTGIPIFLSIIATCLGQLGPPPGARGPAIGVGAGAGGGMGVAGGGMGGAGGGMGGTVIPQHLNVGEPGENPFALDGMCWSLDRQLRAKNPSSSTKEVIADRMHGLISSFLGGGGEIPSSGGGNVACTIRNEKNARSKKKTQPPVADLATAVTDKIADSGCRIPCFDPKTGQWAQPPPGMAPPSPTPALNVEPPVAPPFYDPMGPMADPYNQGLGGRRGFDPMAGPYDPAMSPTQRASRMRDQGHFDRRMRSQGSFGSGRGGSSVDPMAYDPTMGPYDPGMGVMGGSGQFDPRTSRMGRTGQFDPGMGRTGQLDAGVGRTAQFDTSMGRPGQLDPVMDRTGQFDTGMGRTGQFDAGTGRTGHFDAGTGRTGQFDAGTGRTGQFDAGTGRTGQFDAGIGRTGQFDAGVGRSGQFDAGVGRTGQFESGTGRTRQVEAGMGRTGQFDTGMTRTGKFETGMSRARQFDTGIGRSGQFDSGVGRPGQFDRGMGRAGQFEAGIGRTRQLDPGMGRTGQIDPGMGRIGPIDPGMGRIGPIDPGMGRTGQLDPGMDRTGQFDARMSRQTQFAAMERSARDSTAGGSRFNEFSTRGESSTNQGMRSGQFNTDMRHGSRGMETQNLGRSDVSSMGGRNFGGQDSFNRGFGRTEFNERQPRPGGMGLGFNQRENSLLRSGAMKQQGMSAISDFSQRRMGDTLSMGSSLSGTDRSLGMGMRGNPGLTSAMSNRAQRLQPEVLPSSDMPMNPLGQQNGLGQQVSNTMPRDPAQGPVLGVVAPAKGTEPVAQMGATENTNVAARNTQGNNQNTSSTQGETTINTTSTSQQLTNTNQSSGIDTTAVESQTVLNKGLSQTQTSGLSIAPEMTPNAGNIPQSPISISQSQNIPQSPNMMSQSGHGLPPSGGMMSQSSNMMPSSGDMLSSGMSQSMGIMSAGNGGMSSNMLTNVPMKTFPRDQMGEMSNGNNAMFRERPSAMQSFNDIPMRSGWQMSNQEAQRPFTDGTTAFAQHRGNQMPMFSARRPPQGSFFNRNAQFGRQFVSAAAGSPGITFSKRTPINSVNHRPANFDVGDPSKTGTLKHNQNLLSGPEGNQIQMEQNLNPTVSGNSQMVGSSTFTSNSAMRDVHISQIDRLMPNAIPDPGTNTMQGGATQASGASAGTPVTQGDPFSQSVGPLDPMIHEQGFGKPADMRGSHSNGLSMGPDPYMGPNAGMPLDPMHTGNAGHSLDPIHTGFMDMATAVDPFHGAGFGPVGDPLSMMGIGAAGDPLGAPLNSPSSGGMGMGPPYDPPHHSGMGADPSFGVVMGGRMDFPPPPPHLFV